MESLWKDVRFGLRSLRNNPATTLVALLTLALGIGANAAIFGVIRGVLLQPLPYPHPERLMVVVESNPQAGFPRFSVAPLNFKDWREQNRVFEHLAAFQSMRLNLTGNDKPEAVRGGGVSADFFATLGVKPVLGRASFHSEEDQPGGPRVVVLSQAIWQRRYGSDPRILGRAIVLDGESYTVVGVAPEGFDFPRKSELWLPAAFDWAKEHRGAHHIGALGRLRPGVSVTQAQVEMSGIAARLARQYPDADEGWGALVIPLHDLLVEDIRPALSTLEIAVWLVLLIACVNVANLLLARMGTRERELAMRSALGAGRTRLVRQLLTETVVLFAGGGLLGLLLAAWGTRALVALNPDAIPRSGEIGIDGWVLLYTAAVAMVTGVIFGLAPALSAVSGRRMFAALKEGGRALAGGTRGRLIRNLLVLAEVAGALVLLVAAGLILRSFARLRAVDPGFRVPGLLVVDLALPEAKYPDDARQAGFYRQLLERVHALPGVERAASVFPPPLEGRGFVLTFEAQGKPTPPNKEPSANIRVVSPDFFQTLGIPLRRGRVFAESDREGSQPVFIVNQTMAAKIWPGEDPLGKRLTFDDASKPTAKWYTVVGVVGDVRDAKLDQEPKSAGYWPQFQNSAPSSTLVVRTSGDPLELAGAVRAVVRGLDRDLPIARIRSMQDVVAASLAQNEVKTVLISLFAALALVLAAVGIYGLVSYSVSQRTHEIGIRMALGARRGEVMRMVVRQGMGLVLLGLVVGLAGAWFASRLLAGQLYDVKIGDPLTYLFVPLVLAAVALVANLVPARRATWVDPLEALRYE